MPDDAAVTRARAVLTVDLAAVRANWRRLAALATPAGMAAVIKADAYGLGAEPVGRALWAEGARTFFTASVGEGVALRAVLPGARIFILDGLGVGGAVACAGHRLVPVLNQPGELEAWRALARKTGQRLPAALQIDTGMHRAGFMPRDLESLDEDAFDGLDLVLVQSHPACADDPDHPHNRLQLETFERLSARLAGTARSLANSAAIFLGCHWHFDLCRPGIALFGGNPTPAHANPMAPVVTLEATILQTREIDLRGAVGYGASYAVEPGMRIATVALGYADGFIRAAGAASRARVAGIEVPFAGRVSMDMIGLDVSAVPRERLGGGVMAELVYGPDGIDRVAAAAGTIPYEVLVRLGARIERRYLGAQSWEGERS